MRRSRRRFLNSFSEKLFRHLFHSTTKSGLRYISPKAISPKPISPKPFHRKDISPKRHFAEGTFHRRDISPKVHFPEGYFTDIHFAEIYFIEAIDIPKM